MEIELHSFSATMKETCGDTGALGKKFLDLISELQVRIEETARSMQVESDVLISISNVVTNEEQKSGWVEGIDRFQDEWIRFFTAMNKFHIAARMMWESGAYNRGGLESLIAEVNHQKNLLVDSWSEQGNTIGQLKGFQETLAAAADGDIQGGMQSIIDEAMGAMTGGSVVNSGGSYTQTSSEGFKETTPAFKELA